MPPSEPHTVQATLSYYLEPEKGGYTTFTFGTAGEKRRPFASVAAPISDIQGREEDFQLDLQGFQFVRASSKLTPQDTESHARIRQVYYAEAADLLKSITGASRVHIMGHVCRKKSWSAAAEASKHCDDMARVPVVTSARYVHVDYSYAGAKSRLEYYFSAEEAARLQKTRWAIIHLWRPIHAITRENLAMCDARSVSDAELRPVIAKFRRPGDSENLGPSPRAAYDRDDVEMWSVAPPERTGQDHRWYYRSKMEPSEALLLKIFDSSEEGGVARRTPHSAFTCDDDYGPERQSVEVRCFVFWENEEAVS